MFTKLNRMTPFVSLCAVVFAVVSLCGCRSSDVGESMQTGSDIVVASGTMVAIVPVASVAVAAYEVDVAAQGSSIAVGAPHQLYSQPMTKSDLWRLNMQYGCKFHEPWKYMGTKDGEHYLVVYPFLGFREIYRIAEDEYPIEEPFELTARTSKWREIGQFSHLGHIQEFIIEPLLFEQPEGLRLIPVGGWRIDGVAGGVEDQFMQDVQILELE